MTYAVHLPDGYVVSDDRARLDMRYVLASLDTVPWGAGRPHAVTVRSWANCLPFGVYGPDGAQVGFGRLLTDYALRAHLGDVFIDPAVRGRGLGKALVVAVLEHPELVTVKQWTLATVDAHGLYARHGFRLDGGGGKWMVLDRSVTRKAAPG